MPPPHLRLALEAARESLLKSVSVAGVIEHRLFGQQLVNQLVQAPRFVQHVGLVDGGSHVVFDGGTHGGHVCFSLFAGTSGSEAMPRGVRDLQ